MAPVNILNVGYDSTNYYLIGAPGPKLLVDIGWPGTLPKLVHTLQRYRLQLKDIPYALATHYHPDHAGLAQDTKQQGVKLIVMENQTEAVADFGKYMKPENHYTSITSGDNLLLRFDESRKFLAGLGLAGEIIATPGHSDDSVTLVLDEGLAFTGDLHSPEFATEEQREKTLASWAEIRGLGVQSVYPGHGPVQKIKYIESRE
jgi:ribonuclease/clavin/mitogillin